MPLQRKTPLRAKTGFKRRTTPPKGGGGWQSKANGEKAVRGTESGRKAVTTRPVSLEERLDRVFSLYIRLRDAMDGGMTRCISCGRVFPFAVMQCGHYISRKEMATRYEPMNCHSQCQLCNCHEHGNLAAYKENLVKKIGQDSFDDLVRQSEETVKWSDDDLREAIALYTEQVKMLSRKKGIRVSL